MRYIKRVILENFQSHKYSVIDLDGELNVIVGPSDTGKSAIIRGIKWVLYNEPSGDYFIREGEREASVTLEFNDNIKVKRYRSRSKNSYHIFDVDGVETKYEGFGTNVPEEIVEKIGIKKMYLDSDETNSINLGEQLDGAFLLSEKSGTRASAIGRLVGVNLIDDALREALRDNRNLSNSRKGLDETINALELELKEFDYLPDLLVKVNKLEEVKTKIKNKLNNKNRLKELYDKLLNNREDLKQTTKIIDQLVGVEELEKTIKSIEDLYIKYKYYNSKKAIYSKVKLEIEEDVKVIYKLKDLDKCIKLQDNLHKHIYTLESLSKLHYKIDLYKEDKMKWDQISEKLEHLSKVEISKNSIEKELFNLMKITEYYNRLKGIYNNIKIGNNYIKKFERIEIVDEKLILLNKYKEILSNLKELENKYVINKENFMKERERLNIIEMDIEKHLKLYENILSKQEVCPFCLSDIDDDKVKHIMDHYK